MQLDLLNQLTGENFNNMIEDFVRELTNKLEEMETKFTVDRFEGNMAVLENRETGEMINVHKNELPKDAKEGSVLKINENKYELDIEEQKQTEERIKNKMDKLWN